MAKPILGQRLATLAQHCIDIVFLISCEVADNYNRMYAYSQVSFLFMNRVIIEYKKELVTENF